MQACSNDLCLWLKTFSLKIFLVIVATKWKYSNNQVKEHIAMFHDLHIFPFLSLDRAITQKWRMHERGTSCLLGFGHRFWGGRERKEEQWAPSRWQMEMKASISEWSLRKKKKKKTFWIFSDFPTAAAVLKGLLYTLDKDYPRCQTCTCEVIQKATLSVGLWLQKLLRRIVFGFGLDFLTQTCLPFRFNVHFVWYLQLPSVWRNINPRFWWIIWNCCFLVCKYSRLSFLRINPLLFVVLIYPFKAESTHIFKLNQQVGDYSVILKNDLW